MKITKNRGLRGAGFVLAMVMAAYSGATFLGHSTAQQPAPAPDNEYMVGSTLWTQTAAEFRALTYQSFNYARLLFDRDLRNMRRNRMKRAVVVDVDDTVLDNSRYQASLILNRKNYGSSAFTEWCKIADAPEIPGAVEFLKYVHAKGARVFYVSNRSQADIACTSENLKKLGFPDVSDETLLFRTDTSSKEARRQAVAKKHRIVLLMGDNLNDLAKVFEKKPIAERFAAVDAMKNDFGSRFIVLPNAMYGEWEGAVYEYKSLSDQEKAARRRAILKDF
jgi:5'-nucleotidase (lipoprotein e(P4) family)